MKGFTGRTLVLAITMLMLAAFACNLPSKSSMDAALTTIAETEQTTATTSAPTVTSTPIVTVNVATNCRTGPGPNYDLVLVFQPGVTAEVVGKYTPANYWIIKTPNGGTCWLWGQYAAVQGDASKLAEIAPPAAPLVQQPTAVAQKPTKAPKSKSSATATSAVTVINPNPNVGNSGVFNVLSPSEPSNLTISTDCTPPGRDVKLQWDYVSNADGYYVYKNGSQLLTTQSNVLDSYYPGDPSGSIAYGVAAYNSYGTSAMAKVTSYCP